MSKHDSDTTMPYITDTAIAIAGSANAGKSSFVGVITTGILDDGDGSARRMVAKHKHELDSKKTSDVTSRTVKIIDRAITFIDLCGQDRYFKSTAFGITGCYPDVAIVVVSANNGVQPMTKQHYRLIASYNIPTWIIITRSDATPTKAYYDNRSLLIDLCKKYKQQVEFINDPFDAKYDTDEAREFAFKIVMKNLNLIAGKQACVPVITISNKTGYYIDVVKKIIANIKARPLWDDIGIDPDRPSNEIGNENRIVKYFKTKLGSDTFADYKPLDGSIFYIDSCYKVKGIKGVILSGINRGKTIHEGASLFIGPFGKEFKKAIVKSIHNNIRQPISALENHHRGCMAVILEGAELKKNDIKKGMVLVSTLTLASQVGYRFTAAISILNELNNALTIRDGYTPVIHVGTVRQSARLTIDPDKNSGRRELIYGDNGKRLSNIKSGDVAVVTFKFKQRPEFIEPATVFVLTSGEIQGIGVITSVIPVDQDTDAKPDLVKNTRFNKKKFVRRDKLRYKSNASSAHI